jgi:hypothetical protein
VWCIKRGFNVAQVGEAVGIGHHATALVAIANDDRSWPGRTLTSFWHHPVQFISDSLYKYTGWRQNDCDVPPNRFPSGLESTKQLVTTVRHFFRHVWRLKKQPFLNCLFYKMGER